MEHSCPFPRGGLRQMAWAGAVDGKGISGPSLRAIDVVERSRVDQALWPDFSNGCCHGVAIADVECAMVERDNVLRGESFLQGTTELSGRAREQDSHGSTGDGAGREALIILPVVVPELN
jgi:hypothetical protein